MAKILCAYSSLLFSCDHFPVTLTQRESYHPIFDIPQRKLLPYLRKWAANELTEIDSYLLFLATLKSSDMVDFRVPAIRTEFTDSIIAQNMEYLFRTVIKINSVSLPSQIFSRFVISPDTRTLSNVHYWIETWHENYVDFTNGSRRDYENRKLAQREAALERLIKNPHRDISSYASQLADWAAIAGEFPTCKVNNPFGTKPITLSDYYKQIIIRCASKTQLFSVKKADVEELLEHCEEKISAVGSIYSHALFKVLREALSKLDNFLGLGDFDLGSGGYTILEESSDVEHINMKLIIDSAPEEEPKIDQYPTKFQYMRAKAKWDMAKRYGRTGETDSDTSKREGD